jgi:hypothetical protein
MDREQAIKDFLKVNDLEEKLSGVFSAILARKPNALLIFWEEDDGYAAATVPHSAALAYGLATKAYETLVVQDDKEVEEDDDEVEDDPS